MKKKKLPRRARIATDGESYRETSLLKGKRRRKEYRNEFLTGGKQKGLSLLNSGEGGEKKSVPLHDADGEKRNQLP